MQSPDQVVDVPRGRGPVDQAFVLLQPRRIRRIRVVLRRFVGAAARQALDGRDEQFCAAPGEVALDHVARLVGLNRPLRRRKHRAGIERLHDPHDGDAGLAVARDDGPVHRCRAAMPRQQRGMDID